MLSARAAGLAGRPWVLPGRARTDHCAGGGHRALHDLGDPEVAELHEVLRDEDVLRLEVAVQDALGVHVVQRHHQLNKPVEHLRLCEALLRLGSALDRRRQVAALTVRHHDAETIAVQKVLAVAHDTGMVERAQHLHLLLRGQLLLLAVRLHLHLLEAVVLAVAHVAGEEDRAIVSTPDALERVVVLHGPRRATGSGHGVGPAKAGWRKLVWSHHRTIALLRDLRASPSSCATADARAAQTHQKSLN